jgi:hypothetical protein
MQGDPPAPTGPSPGWYADAEREGSQRYWDGSGWTDYRTPHSADAPPGQYPAPDGSPAWASWNGSAWSPQASGRVSESGRDSGAQRATTHRETHQGHIPVFGARARARELHEEVDELRRQLDRLGALSIVELERRREDLEADIAHQSAAQEQQRKDTAQQVEREISARLEHVEQVVNAAAQERDQLNIRLQELRGQVATTEEVAMLQEIGVYEYRHPLSDAVAYQGELKRLQDQIKTMARKDGGAVLAATGWHVNGSLSQGRTMLRDYSKLMLRAYNAEADNLVRGLKPYKLDSAIDRLTKVATTIARLGKTMDISISGDYHALRVQELELTADYLEKRAEEKEREREERARLKEERKAQEEMERERARLEKERDHHVNVLEALLAKGDEEAAERVREDLADVDRAIADVDYRAANVRAGYVYVISNVGALGEGVVKIGLTRRLEPKDRIRELGDASVPFRFDVHALFFSEDAVGIEAELHRRLADRRVNAVNLRREFFYATPEEVKPHLLELGGELLEYEEIAEALEFRQSGSRPEPNTGRNHALDDSGIEETLA